MSEIQGNKKISDVLEILFRKTLYDENGIVWGLTRQEKEERELWCSAVQNIKEQPFRGVVVPFTPTEQINIFQVILAKKLTELTEAGLQFTCFYRDDGYSIEDRTRYLARAKSFLNAMRAIPSKRTGSTVVEDELKHRAEYWACQEMLLRFDVARPMRMALLETHLAALYALTVLHTPFLLVSYVEKSYIDIIRRFLPAKSGDIPDLIPIYLPQLDFGRELIFLDDANKEQIESGELKRSTLSGKIERALFLNRYPTMLLAQLDCLILDRQKNINSETILLAENNLQAYQSAITQGLERELRSISSKVVSEEIV